MAEKVATRSKPFLGWLAYAAGILILMGIEFAYFLDNNSILRQDAALAWIVISVSFLLLVTLGAFRLFFQASFWRDKDKFWYLTAFVLPIALIYLDIGGVTWTPINDEGAQQVAQAMDLLRQDPDFGIYRLAYFVGYIDRQYVLASMPTYFFGPSLVALRLGNSWVYLGGYLAFLAAMAHYFKARNALNPLLLASFAGMMISLGQYALIQARVFEQTTMPIGAMLLFLAGVFYFLSGVTPFRTFWVTWSFGFFAGGYTPALGGWWLALVVLLYLALHPQHKYRILGAPVIYGCCCLLVACLVLSGANTLQARFKIGPPELTAGDRIWRYFLGYHSLLGAGFSVLPCPLALAAIAVCYFSFKYRDYRFPLLGVWCAAIALLSLTCIGSNFNSPQFDIHRAIFILPPLAAGAVVFYHVYGSRLDPSRRLHPTIMICARVAMVYMIYTGAAFPWTERTYIYHRNMTDYDEALYKIDCVNFDPKMKKIAKLYIVPPLEIGDLETGLAYFAPSAVLIRGNPPPGEKQPGAYLLSYLSDNEEDRKYDVRMPSRHARPYLQLKPE
jgi:hypothetical protein